MARGTANIWIAASDGDLDRVKHLIEVEGMSPNVPDPNTYTPMHAAASYAHMDVLEYLVSKGGDVNVKDEDGETPLFTVESLEVAQYLVANGADVNVVSTGDDQQTAAQSLASDFPEIALYLHSVSSDPSAPFNLPEDEMSQDDEDEAEGGAGVEDEDQDMDEDQQVAGVLSAGGLSAMVAEHLSEDQTQEMLVKFGEIMAKSEEDGINRDAELEEVVQQTLFAAMNSGRSLASGGEAESSSVPSISDASEKEKRQRRDDGNPGR